MKRSIALTFALAVLACAITVRRQAEAAPAEAATHLIIVFHVAEDRLQDFLPIMTGINEGMADEKGFKSAVVYRDADNPLAFTLIEKWESRALHEAHYDRIVTSGDWENIQGMLTETPVLRYNEKL